MIFSLNDPEKGFDFNLSPKCPADGERLERYTLHGFEIDTCPRCKGVFYDQTEFASIVNNLTHASISPELSGLVQSQNDEKIKSTTHPSEMIRHCPRDRSLMLTFAYGGDSGIFIDRCSKCEGIWIDGGELHAIKEYLKPRPHVEKLAIAIIEQEKMDKEDWQSAPFALLAPLYFIPYKDDLKTQKFPWLTVGLIAVNFFAYFFFILPASFTDLNVLFLNFGFLPAVYNSAAESYRYITSMFLHVDFFHLIGNMLFLWIFGDNIEERFGKIIFFTLFFTAGIAAALGHTLSDPTSIIPAVGASGAISGIIGSYLILFPSSRLKLFTPSIIAIYLLNRFTKDGMPPVITLNAGVYLFVWFFFQFVFILLGSSSVAYFAHIGGFIWGAIIAFVLKKAKIA